MESCYPDDLALRFMSLRDNQVSPLMVESAGQHNQKEWSGKRPYSLHSWVKRRRQQ